MSVNDIAKCSRCKKVLIGDEFNTHSCLVETVAVRRIALDFYTVIRDDKNKETILAQGLDGIMYVMVVISKGEANRLAVNTQNATPEDNTREGNTTKILVITSF